MRVDHKTSRHPYKKLTQYDATIIYMVALVERGREKRGQARCMASIYKVARRKTKTNEQTKSNSDKTRLDSLVESLLSHGMMSSYLNHNVKRPGKV